LRFILLLEQHCCINRYQNLKDDMRMYICNFPRMRTLKFFCAAFAMLTVGLPISAQNGRPNTNSSGAQTELHINAIVVPVIIPPRHERHRDHDDGFVSYNLSPQEQKLSITEEVRPMLVKVDGRAAEQQLVQQTTVVAR
jgi:hypothetical protein